MVRKKNAKGATFTRPRSQHQLARDCERGGSNVRWTCGRGGSICALRQCVEESATDDDDDDENDEG